MSRTVRLLAVDGFNLIRRIFEARHAASPGDMASVVESAVSSLQRAVRQHEPTHAVVVLEHHERTWRHLLYSDYKANRSPTPALLLEAMPEFERGFESVGVSTFSLQSYEADDLIATLTHAVASHGGQVVILSTDKIFFQLTGPLVRQYDHFNETWLDEEALRRRFAIRPEQYLDYLALVGDRTNNIHGVEGIGQKSAVQLLEEYDDLEHILSSEAETRLVTKVQAAREQAELSRMLVTLKQDVELGINLRSFRLQPTR